MLLYYVAGGYTLSSLILLFYPSLLHKRKVVKFPSRFMAHRGGGGERTENTLDAFTEAKRLNVDLFECDVQMTKDGEVIVSHDDDLSRVCGENKKISEHVLADLPLCLQEMEVATEPGAFLHRDRQEPLLRLEDLYRAFPDVPIQIDVKPGGLELISKVSDLTKKYNREHITVWGAFSHTTTTQCRKHNPNMLTFCSFWESALYPFLFLLGLLQWMPISASFYHVAIPNISNKSGFLSTWPKWFCHLTTPLLCNSFLLSYLHRRGVRTGSWVLNHEHEFKASDEWGFYGTMTDYPSRFIKYEQSRTGNKQKDN